LTYRLEVARSASRAITQELPGPVAPATVKFMTGPLLAKPQLVGKRLRGPLNSRWSARRGQYCVIYTIDIKGEVVTVLHISHRRDSYR